LGWRELDGHAARSHGRSLTADRSGRSGSVMGYGDGSGARAVHVPWFDEAGTS
jgi:hypothetical protein